MAGSGSKCRSPFEPIEAVQVHTRPVLLQGTDNPPRLLETSGITSTGRLYGQEPFLNVSTEGVEEQWERPQAAPLQGATATSTDGGAQDEQEEPQAVSSKEADKSTSKSEPEPDPTAASAGNDVDAAVEEFDGINPLSPIAKGAVDSMGSANAASTEVQALSDTYLEPLRVFNSVVSTLANIHPYAQAALGILTSVSQLFLNQAILDTAVFTLLDTVRNVYEFLLQQDRMSNINNDTLARITRAISDSAHFIQNYSAVKNFWKGTGKNIFSKTNAVVDDHVKSLENLMQQCRDHMVGDTNINTYRIFEDLNLDGMAYSAGAGLNTTKKCLDGTRTEILLDIMNWINDPDANVPRILWLHGQAGRGKSAIAFTIASWIKDVGGLGSWFCFARDSRAECREEKILTTIARDLADRDPAFRRALADIVSTDASLRTTPDLMQQWQRLILEPLSKIKGTIARNVVMVIDALDESGSVKSREHILSLLTSTEATCFPPNFRILLTSRPLPDIARALGAAQHVKATSLDNIPIESAEHDIRLYVSRELAYHPEIGPREVQSIVEKSNGLLEWARLACRFIRPNKPGRTIMERYNNTMMRDSGGALLDVVYRTILEDLVPEDRIPLARFHSVMRQIMSTSVPQRLDALNEMRSHFPSEEDHFDMMIVLEFMAPLLSGIADRSFIVRPLHPSFYDFLRDRSRSGVYCVDGSNTDMHSSLASASLHTLSGDLEPSIRGSVDSSQHNVETGQDNTDRRMDFFHLESNEPLPDISTPGSAFWEFGASPLSVCASPEAQKIGVKSRLSTLLRRRKFPQCAQERMQTLPVAVQAAREKMRLLVASREASEREGQVDQSGQGNTLHQFDTITSVATTRDGQIGDDGYHKSHCVCYFKRK